MPQFPAAIDLSTLSGSSGANPGVRLDGIAISDFSGRSVASAGDVNGDGFADVIIGAFGADPGGDNYAGESYVVFGKASGFAPSLDLFALDGTNGFRLDGIDPNDFSGRSVASAGDVNGDGFDDVIIGADGGDPGGDNYAGESYVVFGKASGFAPSLDLATLNGTNGFRLDGIDAADFSGVSVASAGDVNGDGFGDLIVGAYGGDPGGDSTAGESYVVFGKASGFAASLDLATLNGSNGFRLDGIDASDFSGYSVASAGDINGDGFDDLIIGASRADPGGDNYAGESYVVFGKASGFPSAFDLATLNGTNGFRLDGIDVGDQSGLSVASAGDVNGDGFADFVIGAGFADPGGDTSAGESYVVFGKASGFAASLDLSTLNGSNGFRLDGIDVGDQSGRSVASAGDVNGDGFDDLIIGARYGDPGGDSAAGESYVVFGQASGFAASLDLAALNGTNGFRLDGIDGSDYSGRSVASAGDVNGDGFADLVIGAPNADALGDSNAGESYIVFGRKPDTAVNRAGTVASQTLAGGDFGDALAGLGGNDALWGHGGNDTLDGGAGIDTMRGGAGDDTYVVDSLSDLVLEFAGQGTDTVVSSILSVLPANVEVLIFTGAGNVNVTGNADANTLTGNAGRNVLAGKAGNDILSGLGGNDILDGGLGADTMKGGLGNDTYFVDSPGDVVSEIGGGGIDTVKSMRTFSLADPVHAKGIIENLTLLGFAKGNATGNAAANVITGNAAQNILDGGASKDALNGGGGNDVVIGGLGRDQLTGGLGADDFKFKSLSEIGKGLTRDVIKDFQRGIDDIDLRSIDTKAGLAGDQAFVFLPAKGAAFTGTKGELRWFQIELAKQSVGQDHGRGRHQRRQGG